MPVDMAAEYGAGRERLSARLTSVSDTELAAPVPACPRWVVRDIASHLTGVAADTVANNFPTGDFETWTQIQVDSRRDRSLDDVLAEWAELSPKIEALIESAGTRMNFLVADVVSHEFDVLGAVGEKGARDAPVVVALADMFVTGLGRRLDDASLPALDVSIADGDGGPWHVGKDGTSVAVVTPSAFETLRAMSGRRNADQIDAWDWSADPAPFHAVLSIFPSRTEPLAE
jgi:uncharacterized protein (TIGR03083 family)